MATDTGHGPYAEDDVPARYRRIAADPASCLARAAEILDYVTDGGDTKEMAVCLQAARAWIRLAEAADRIAGKT
jgi:hypothetical protein